MKQSNSRNSAFQLTASQGGWPHLAGWPLSVPYFNSQPHKEADKDVIVPSRPIWYFNSQPHKEADWWPGKRVMWWRWFQLTASQGGWRVTRSWKTSWLAISTHSLTRRLTIFALSEDHCMCISTHSLTRRLTEENQRILCERVFQLTASQGGWPASIKVIAVGAIISTHSLTRRLTIRYTIVNRCVLISTHSLTRRLTGNSSYILSANYISTHSLTRRLTTSDTILDIVKSDFNSQPHKEADEYETEIQMDIFISTHSLTRRLTEENQRILCERVFQLTASQGGWPQMRVIVQLAGVFQLTASQGGWQFSSILPAHSRNFNSQPHKEADNQQTGKLSHVHISTHSLTRRLTDLHIHQSNSGTISTHSLTRRLTTDTLLCSPPWFLFQLTASQGGWQCLHTVHFSSRKFQLTASQGGWHQF